jgi:cyclase
MVWNRREFLKLSSYGLVAAALPRSAFALVRTGEFTTLRRNVGIYSERGGTIGWLITPDGAAIVDSQFADTAANLLEGVRGRTAAGIDVLVNTHHHSDHTAGNAVLRPAARSIVAHARVPELLRTYESQQPQTYPDTTFDREWSTTVGDETVRAKHYGRAHTGGDVTVLFERANVVHMGDLMFNRMVPFIDGPSGASVRGWIQVLEGVMNDHSADTIFVFGHGSQPHGVTGTRADLGVMRDYLSALLENAAAGRRAGRTPEQLATQGVPGFPDHQGPENRLATAYQVAFHEL